MLLHVLLKCQKRYFLDKDIIPTEPLNRYKKFLSTRYKLNVLVTRKSLRHRIEHSFTLPTRLNLSVLSSKSVPGVKSKVFQQKKTWKL